MCGTGLPVKLPPVSGQLGDDGKRERRQLAISHFSNLRDRFSVSHARLIAATNRDLKAMVDDQKFRSDLYYRLNVFPVRVPALRERVQDIPVLVRHFIQHFSDRNNRLIDTIPSETMEALVRYHWPGNIRELQNVVERAVIISRGPVLRVPTADLQSEIKHKVNAANREGSKKTHERLQNVLDETERSEILRALGDPNWVVSGANDAATRLGLKRSTLQLRMKRLGIRLVRAAVQHDNFDTPCSDS